MYCLKPTIHLCVLALVVCILAKDESIDHKSRDKRQQIAFYPRRGARPPPYAVQMEPIVQYSQRDPLYNPTVSAKSDEDHDSLYEEVPLSHYPTEPEPIIEIIIKESNESLPTVPPPTPSPTVRPTKEPIQVFYVKYEKKKNYADGKSKVVYDSPIPALTPVEEHEEIPIPENMAPYTEASVPVATPALQEPSTTLRALIRPDSEVYHSGSSGIRVTFGTEQVPPNNHNKRSDLEIPPTPQSKSSPSPASVPPGTPKRQHGPFSQLQPVHQRGPPPNIFPQHRIVNSFPPQQIHQQPPQQLPFPPQPNQFQTALSAGKNPLQRPQRLPITVQGLPEVQQRAQFSTQPHRISINHPLQAGFPPPLSISHQSINIQNSPPALGNNFNQESHPIQQSYKQQEQEKHRYHEQRRQQELSKQREHHQRIIEQQKQQEQQILQELQEQRIRKQEQEHQLAHEYQFRQSQQRNNAGEILKSVSKLEQHFAIRENPLHPGPFPLNPTIVQQGQSSFPENVQNQFFNHQLIVSHNLPTSQQQRVLTQQQSPIWARPILHSINNNQKIYATPVSVQEDHNQGTLKSSYSSSTIIPSIGSTENPVVTTTTIGTTSTTLSTKNEAKIKENIANLPQEVPDDIREQLLSSGILGNADIQILDYDKIGDIPIDKLPPEALANFYGAGGASAVGAPSEPIPSILTGAIKKSKIANAESLKTAASSITKFEQATLKPGGVEMKVVRFDPNTEQGQSIADHHIGKDATRIVEPVNVGVQDSVQYHRYLPLKVNGASFPIPEVPELNGRKISSVVVLAPVDYNFEDEKENDFRQAKKIINDVQAIKFLAGDTLKQLVRKPNTENYKKWLEQESRTIPQRQSVILLVTVSKNDSKGDKEIFMYDVFSQSMSKLSGDLSTAFVDAAESNSEGSDSIEENNTEIN